MQRLAKSYSSCWSQGEEKILCKGGRGGLGNNNFKTSTRGRLRVSLSREDGQEGWCISLN